MNPTFLAVVICIPVGMLLGGWLVLAIGWYEALTVDRAELDELREIHGNASRAQAANQLAGIPSVYDAVSQTLPPRYPKGFMCGECD